jgi:signal transduction histidine kinase
MTATLSEVLTALDRSRALVEDVMGTAQDPAQRASLLCTRLAAVWPRPIYACLLRGAEGLVGCVLDQGGKPHPDGQTALRDELARYANPGSADPAGVVELPAGVDLADHGLLVQRVVAPDHCHGVLALAVPHNLPSEDVAAAQAVLAACAGPLALCLSLEGLRREHEALAKGRGEKTCLTSVVEATDLVGHELNNVLNNIILHTALVERAVPREVQTQVRPELGVIRQAINRAAGLVRRLQQLSQKHQGPLGPVDLNRVVREAAGAARPDVPVRLKLADDLPPVLGNSDDLGRLVTLLLEQAAGAAGSGGAVAVRTEQQGDRAVLAVEDTGPAIPADLLDRAFEPFLHARGPAAVEVGEDDVTPGLSVCKLLTRRQKGTINAANREGGGVTISVQLGLANP